MTRERSIILTGDEVRGVLSGAKTQARRVVRWPVLGPSDGRKRRVYTEIEVWEISATPRLCPLGAPGDLLWVRETWRVDDYDPPSTIYAADHPEAITETRGIIRWRPSIHMPRWASRITLRVTSVRVDRLRAITEEDAQAEGAPGAFTVADGGDSSHRAGFRSLWRSIYGDESWAADPWVWVVSFERVTP